MFSIFPEVDNWGLKKSERIIKDSAEGIFLAILQHQRMPRLCIHSCVICNVTTLPARSPLG